MTNRAPKCIECGGPVDSLNEDENGEACPACAERLLETLPGIFHAPWVVGAAEGPASEAPEDDDATTPHGGDEQSNRG